MNIHFQKIVEENSERIYRLAYSFFHNQEEAEDITQETFLAAFKKINQFSPLKKGDQGGCNGSSGEVLFPWLYRIAVNKCKDRLRRKKLIKFIPFSGIFGLLGTEEEVREFDPPDKDQDPQKQSEKLELRNILNKAVEGLPEKYREAVTMDLNNFSIKEIAAALGKNEGTVKSIISRGKQKLRQALKGKNILSLAPVRERVG